MDLTVIALPLLAAIAVGGIAYALLYPYLSGGSRADKRRKEYAQPAVMRAKVERDAQGRVRRTQVAQSLKEIEAREVARTKLTLETRLNQAGLSWSRKKFYVVSVVTAVVTGLIVWILTGKGILGLTGLLVGGLGLPSWYLKRRKSKRLQKFGAELPDALDVIVRGIRSGLPLNDCIRIVATEAREPVATEFRLIVESQALGLTLGESTGKLFSRMPCAEANFFGIVLAIQQSTGGNLAETLANLSRVLRDRRKMRDKIQAMSMEAKASAWIIGALPVIVAVLVYISSPKYITLLWTTQAGQFGLVVSAFWMLIGVLTMKKMINFDI